jgi:thiol-disulfide isomerase/thioredoxin
MIRAILFTFLLVITQAFPMVAQKAAEFTGKLDAELTAERAVVPLKFTVAKPDVRSKLPDSLAKEAQILEGELKWSDFKKPGHQLLLIQSPAKAAYIYVDIDKNEKFSAEERFDFSPFENMQVAESDGEVVVRFPLPNSAYKSFPVRLRHRKAAAKQEKENLPDLFQSGDAFATGSVNIQNRKTLVQYQVNRLDGSVSGRHGYLGMDSDGDGKIDASFVSSESAYAENEAVIFRVGENYVSTKSVDADKGIFVLSEHPATDYKRIELRLGVEVPDFNFTDFQGKARKLSEFRGKYVMLEFWGTWCGPCISEIPHLKKAYAKYQSRGFEILGMDEDKELTQVKKFVAEQGMTWTNATTESIREVIKQRFRIVAFPTAILLDPQGKIVSLSRKDQLPLRDEKLLETLEKLLPAQ